MSFSLPGRFIDRVFRWAKQMELVYRLRTFFPKGHRLRKPSKDPPLERQLLKTSNAKKLFFYRIRTCNL